MRSFTSLILVALLIGTAACRSDEIPPVEPTAESVVAALFALAAQDDLDLEQTAQLFAPVEDERRRAELLDAIRALRTEHEAEVVESYTLAEQGRIGFDLEGRLTGDGVARFSVLLDTTTPPGVVVWFSGPGVEWPERKRRGPGISTSSPPAPLEGG